MIASVAIDPNCLEPLFGTDESAKALAFACLSLALQSHILVTDKERKLLLALESHCQSPLFPPVLRSVLEARLNSQAIVEIESESSRRDALSRLPGDVRPESRVLLSLRADKLDALITDDEGFFCAKHAALDSTNLFTLGKFILSELGCRLMLGGGVCETAGMERKHFEERVIYPIVKWSEQVSLVDRFICTAMYQRAPNWDEFKRTIQCVYQTWWNRCELERGRFVVLTVPRRREGEPYPSEKEQKKQAKELMTALELGPGALVKLIKLPDEYRSEVQHDRYLITNRGIHLNLSRGFDMIKGDDTLLSSTISLFRDTGVVVPRGNTVLKRGVGLASIDFPPNESHGARLFAQTVIRTLLNAPVPAECSYEDVKRCGQ